LGRCSAFVLSLIIFIGVLLWRHNKEYNIKSNKRKKEVADDIDVETGRVGEASY
jgi:hypothetical protein